MFFELILIKKTDRVNESVMLEGYNMRMGLDDFYLVC